MERHYPPVVQGQINVRRHSNEEVWCGERGGAFGFFFVRVTGVLLSVICSFLYWIVCIAFNILGSYFRLPCGSYHGVSIRLSLAMRSTLSFTTPTPLCTRSYCRQLLAAFTPSVRFTRLILHIAIRLFCPWPTCFVNVVFVSVIYCSLLKWFCHAPFIDNTGFILMCPQLYINYKLRSVAHLPWKMLCYRLGG